ncbi:hypothetical protein RND71_042142 [Anisodus tanguticus]|uniref:Pentatricopeptide repeat-containing protein n=1 Tax=Anisodus tanguticus TaxID=243964 RepID=A0AAE1QQ27_9SOLA|nr:hypothetical protein RND71_042142 [Anisodus tanguticus]
MPNRDPAAWNAMITAYVDEGLMTKANELSDSMPYKDLVSCNVMIDGYAKSGLEGEALNCFILMLAESDYSYQSCDLMWGNLGIRCAYGLKPRAEAYCCLVDILGCGKLVEEAIRVVNQMPPEKCDGAVLGDLLGACKLYMLE